jgi:hypothetical protein
LTFSAPIEQSHPKERHFLPGSSVGVFVPKNL